MNEQIGLTVEEFNAAIAVTNIGCTVEEFNVATMSNNPNSPKMPPQSGANSAAELAAIRQELAGLRKDFTAFRQEFVKQVASGVAMATGVVMLLFLVLGIFFRG